MGPTNWSQRKNQSLCFVAPHSNQDLARENLLLIYGLFLLVGMPFPALLTNTEHPRRDSRQSSSRATAVFRRTDLHLR